MKTKLLLLSLLCASHCLAQEKLIIVNEGMWQNDNTRLSYFEDGKIVSNEWFREINGVKLGDTATDIIQINDTLIAIALNTSNIVQFITPEGKAVGASEEVANNRKLASDGKNLYVTSYAHEVEINGKTEKFTKGFVAKIDVSTFKVTAAAEVGFEPEGVAYYKGYLFVANSGGYGFQENHDYETTVSVINAETMQMVRTVDTRQSNLYGCMSQSGKYLCINSPGDYYETMAATVIFDCEAAISGNSDEECFIKIDAASTYNTTDHEGNFLVVGSVYSFYTGGYEYNFMTINPKELFESEGRLGVEESLPSSVQESIEEMSTPYGIYVNPYTGFIYATDAGDNSSAGTLYQWSAEGDFVGKWQTYVNPAYFLALPPDGKFENPDNAGIESVEITDLKDSTIYNLQGLPVSNPQKGQIYIQNSRKFIFTDK